MVIGRSSVYRIVNENGSYDPRKFESPDAADVERRLKAGALACLTLKLDDEGVDHSSWHHSCQTNVERGKFTIHEIDSLFGVRSLPQHDVLVTEIVSAAEKIITNLKLPELLGLEDDDIEGVKSAIAEKLARDDWWLDHHSRAVLKIYCDWPETSEVREVDFAAVYAQQRTGSYDPNYIQSRRDRWLSGILAVIDMELPKTDPNKGALARFYDAYHPFG